MEPQTQAVSGVGSLDPQAVNLAKAIRQSESGGDFSAPGKSGEYGAYQYTPDTWAKDSAAAGVNVPLKQATPEQQNQVAYTKIKSLKDKGYNIGQTASVWNAGEGEPNAYTGKFSDGSPSVGTNKHGVKFDVPKYAKSVATAYQTLKGGGQVQADPNNPSSVASTQNANVQPQDQNQDKGFFGNLASGNLLGAGKNALDFALPIVGDIGGDINGTNKKSALQQAGDLGISALTAIAGASLLPESVIGAGAAGLVGTLAGTGAETALGRIGGQAALGAGFAGSQSLAQGETDPQKIAQSALTGGAVGGAVGGAGELVSKALQILPKWLTASAIGTSDPETIQYAMEQGLKSPAKMLARSDASLSSVGSSLGSVLSHPENAGITAAANDIFPSIIKQFPNAGLTNESIGAALLKVAPLQKDLIEKISSGEGLNIQELQTLKSALGKNTFKTVFDDPMVKAGKELSSSFYHSADDFIRSKVPEAGPLLDQYSKEITLNKALNKAVVRGAKYKPFNLRDLMATIAGFSTAGPVGAAIGLGGEKLLTSKTANLRAAGLMNRIGNMPNLSPALTGLVSRNLGQ